MFEHKPHNKVTEGERLSTSTFNQATEGDHMSTGSSQQCDREPDKVKDQKEFLMSLACC